MQGTAKTTVCFPYQRVAVISLTHAWLQYFHAWLLHAVFPRVAITVFPRVAITAFPRVAITVFPRVAITSTRGNHFCHGVVMTSHTRNFCFHHG